MSDDDNDLGGLAPTTPAVRVKKTAPTRGSKHNIRSEAGPSSKPNKGGRKKAPAAVSDSEIEEADPFSNGDHPTQTRKTQPTREDSVAANGKLNGKGKGKMKAAPAKTSSRLNKGTELMGIDAIEVSDEAEAEQQPEAPELHAGFKDGVGRSKRTNATTTRSTKDSGVTRMAERLKRAEERITNLSHQLDEALQIRNTEAEALLQQQEAQHQAENSAKEALIKELTSQLARKEPLMQSGNASVLNLLTREAADEEKLMIENEVQRWKSKAEEIQRTTMQRSERITELEKQERELRVELKAEIERSASLAAKANRGPPSAVRAGGRPGGVDDPRHAEVVRFYEDITNLLIPNMKTQPGPFFGMEDWVLSCIYTFSDEGADDQSAADKKSLNFMLKFSHEPPDPESSEPITSKSQLVPTVYYTPLELDKEPPEFVEKLEFLNAPFSFQRNQLPLFLRTLYKNMNEAVLGEDDNEEDDDDSVQLLS